MRAGEALILVNLPMAAWLFWVVFIGVLWGSTNPLLARASKGEQSTDPVLNVSAGMPKGGLLSETKWLFTNWRVRGQKLGRTECHLVSASVRYQCCGVRRLLLGTCKQR